MSATTLNNLIAAFNGESNAHARYAAFAQKADAEGYAQVASLFRAASRAEEIHAANHAKVIAELGGNPLADIQPNEINSTAENLKTAIAGETYEKDIMYPQFIEQASKEDHRNAVRTFKYAMQAEIEHAALYQSALDNLADWKTGTKDFFVCPICGKTESKIVDARCAVCLTPTSKFEKVN